MQLMVSARPNQAWSADFVSDALYHGMRFRTFNVQDDFNREALAIESRIPISRGTIEPYAMTGSVSTCSTVSPRCRTLRTAGYGPTITNDRTWGLAVSPQNRSWPWWSTLLLDEVKNGTLSLSSSA